MDHLNSYTPKRSILYVPGSNERALKKITSLDADGFILDLEDAVAPDKKVDARETITEFMKNAFLDHKDVVIRINGLDTKWGENDLKSACALAPSAILAPKVENCEEIGRIHELMNDYGVSKNTKIWAMIETPLGVLNAKEIAECSTRLTCLVMGTSDLANDLRATHTEDRTPLVYSLSHTLLAARAAGKDIIDGVHLDLKDKVGFEKSCWQGKELGFDGKSLIHPNQIEYTNHVFGPSDAELDHSSRIIDTFNQAVKGGQGVAVFDGQLIENLHVENAKRIIQMNKVIRNRK